MSLAAKLRRAPMRIATGAFILNSGLQKLRSADDETAKHIHGAASGAYPMLGNIEPRVLLKVVGAGETALGGALLLPIVPARLAGAGLTGFAASLLGVWWRTPGMHEPGSLRPTQQGTAIAKDSWMLGIGTSLLLDSVVSGPSESRAIRRAERRAGRQARKDEAKAEAKARKEELKAATAERRQQLRAEAKQRAKALQAEAKAQAQAQAKAARKGAAQAGDAARSALDSTRSAAESAAGKSRSAAESAADRSRSLAESAADRSRSLAESAADKSRSAAGSVADRTRSVVESAADKVGV